MPGGKQTGNRSESAGDRLERVVIEPQSPVWLSTDLDVPGPRHGISRRTGSGHHPGHFHASEARGASQSPHPAGGQGRIVAATKFVDEAGQRISRFLLMQAIVNGAFGLILGLGLLLMGVKYALLWGFLARMLRYLPYIGPYLAAVFPISLSVAMFDGWGTTLMVVGLIPDP